MRQMAFWMLGGAIARVEEDRRRRIGAAEGLVVAHIGPQPPGARFALCEDRNGRLVAMHARAGENMIANEIVERPKQQGAAADLIGERRQAQIHAFMRIAHRLSIQRLASRAGELHPRALPEPYVSLSTHTAPSVRTFACKSGQ